MAPGPSRGDVQDALTWKAGALYHPSAMQSASPRQRLDVEELASRRAVLTGFVGAESMPRLLEVVSGTPPAIAYRIEFARDTSRRAKIVGRAGATLPLVCQRCLGALEWRLETKFELVVVGDGHDGTHTEEAVVCPGGRIALEPMIEDELLLVVPHAPVHPHGSCEAPPVRNPNGGAPPAARDPFSPASPFRALRTLRSRRHPEQSS